MRTKAAYRHHGHSHAGQRGESLWLLPIDRCGKEMKRRQ